jgi:hypothetical protein
VLTLVVMGCKVLAASSGGCTHFLTTPDAKGGTMTVGFGQGCVSGSTRDDPGVAIPIANSHIAVWRLVIDLSSHGLIVHDAITRLIV